MRVLVTGRGTSGSWAIRGQQLGAAIGATVAANAAVAGYDHVVLVKRGHAPGCVLDVVDGWPQPDGNHWPRHTAMEWLRAHVAQHQPKAIVAATQQMALDCAAFSVPVLWLAHHARPGQAANPIRERVAAVGYEGGERQLGRWREVAERLCAERGWRFVVNPAALADVDIVVALRDAEGYPARNWKSGVKLANAQATGTPVILSPEAGYRETQSGAEYWAATETDLADAMDRLVEWRERKRVSRELKGATPHLSTISGRYLAWLQTLKS